MPRKLFWKLALTFIALLLSVLLAVDLLAERTLRASYENDSYQELQALARALLLQPLQLSAVPPQTPEDTAALRDWVNRAASTGARVTVISSQGTVLADSSSETVTMESHAQRPEVIEALKNGEGRSTRHSVSVNRALLYYARRVDQPGGNQILIRLALPVDGIDQALGKFRTQLWLWSLLILLFAGAIALWISRSFVDRIERLREFSRRVAEGDFRPLPSDGKGDTLEALGGSLNQTAERLDRTIRTLTEERNLSSAILGSMVEGVAVVNGAERLVFANPGFAEILGLDVPPVAGSSLLEIVRQRELIDAVRRVLVGESPRRIRNCHRHAPATFFCGHRRCCPRGRNLRRRHRLARHHCVAKTGTHPPRFRRQRVPRIPHSADRHSRICGNINRRCHQRSQ